MCDLTPLALLGLLLDPDALISILSLLVAVGVLISFLIWNQRARQASRAEASAGHHDDLWTDASSNRQQILVYSIVIMSVVTLCVGALTARLLYHASFEQQRQRLIETASAQARLIEAIARFDRIHASDTFQGDAVAATISQIVDAHQNHSGFGETGEFTLARLVNDKMEFLLEPRHSPQGQELHIPFRDSPLAEPMRKALAGQSGTVVARDYRGEMVLAAYEPIPEVQLGIVAKIDLWEIQRPFRQAGFVGLCVSVLLISIAGVVIVWVNSPLIRRVEDRERRLDAILSNVVDAIFTVDQEGNILSFNEAAETIFGYSAAEAEQINLRQLMAQPQPGQANQTLADLTQERHEMVGSRQNGQQFLMDIALSPMGRSAAGLRVGIARDITDRREMEEELRRVNFLSDIALELTGCGYWHVDYSEPDFYYLSDRARKMLGEEPQAGGKYNLKKDWLSRLQAADEKAARQTAQRYQATIEGQFPTYEAQYPYRRPADGQVIWLHAIGKVDRDANGNLKFMYGAYQDVTQQLQIQRAMAEAQQAAESANRAKSDFLSHMSHELRTPLNGILGYAQILKRESDLNSRQRSNLQAIVNCGDHLLALINDVLDLSKIEAGHLEVDLAATDLHSLLQSVSDVVRQRATDKGLNYKLDLEPTLPRGIVTDAAKVRQILVNLLGNAVKFTHEGTVTMRVRQANEQRLRFEIIDTGIGMSEEEISQIFDPFKQVEAGKAAGGTGLGLAISSRLTSALAGKLDVSSQPGQGSTFTLELPCETAEPPTWPEMSSGRLRLSQEFQLKPGHKASILIADDRETNRNVLQGMLQPAGFSTRLATNGDEALDVLREFPNIDLVLMDVRMPVKDGLAALKEIRQDEKLQHIKVIAVTASVFPEFQKQALEVGFDDFLGKPFRTEELMRSLRQHLRIEFAENAHQPAGSSQVEDTHVLEPPTSAETSERASAHSSTHQHAPVSGRQLPTPSREILKQLREALAIRNLTALSDLVEKLHADESTAAIGTKLTKYLDAFDFVGLETLVATLEHDHEQ